MTVRERIQRLDLGTPVELFHFDLSRYSLGSYHFVTGDEGDTVHTVTFDGQDYTPMAIDSSGWGASGAAQNSRPKLSIANVGGLFTPLVLNNNDLRGATVTRLRTFAEHLDDGDDPDPSAILPIDVYRINRKTGHTPKSIQWELVSPIDQEGAELPNRTVIRDYCGHSYREWTGSSFDYSNASCPYNGTVYRDEDDEVVTAALDRCSRRLGSCKLRFGANALLPTRAFPGAAKYKGR